MKFSDLDKDEQEKAFEKFLNSTWCFKKYEPIWLDGYTSCYEEIEEKLAIAIEALEKVEDTRKIGHAEPDNYTKLCCLANIANVALEKIT